MIAEASVAPWYVIFIPVFSALMGGIIAIGAAFLAGWWQSVLKERSERLQKRREKLERFLDIAHELSVFPFRLKFDEEVQPQKLVWQGYIDELTTLTLLHLPELLPAASMMTGTSQELFEIAEQVIDEANDEGLNEETKRIFDERNERVSEAYSRAATDAVELAERLRMQDNVKMLSSWEPKEDDPSKS